MAGTYNISFDSATNTLKVGFGAPAQNDQIVQDAQARIDEMIQNGELAGGKVVKINGPASLPAACVLAHAVGHLYGAVGIFDPKLGRYVISITHDPELSLGSLID